jgi:hypothetical protein
MEQTESKHLKNWKEFKKIMNNIKIMKSTSKIMNIIQKPRTFFENNEPIFETHEQFSYISWKFFEKHEPIFENHEQISKKSWNFFEKIMKHF